LSTGTELGQLHQLIADLRVCAKSLMATYGECPATRRIVNDTERIINSIERVDIDLEELERASSPVEPVAPRHMIQIPDTQYDYEFWRDVDHEGIGGQNGACAHRVESEVVRENPEKPRA
jgi:hypothetical protein